MTSIIFGLLLLAILIVIHEFGHYIVAKACGVKVLTFSVGFGPKVFGFKRGDTDYQLSLIPLGGYVRMFGDQIEEDVSEEEKKYSFLHQPIWKKSLIAFAGPLFNFILPVFLFLFMFWGAENYVKPIMGTVMPNSAAEKAGILSGDEILAIDSQPVSEFKDLVTLVSANPDKPIVFNIRREIKNKPKYLSLSVTPKGEPDLNPLNKGKKVGRIGVLPNFRKPIVAANYHLGLEHFDEILEANNQKIKSFDDLERVLGQKVKNLKVKRKKGGENGEYRVVDLTSPIPERSDLSSQTSRKIIPKYHGIMSDEQKDVALNKRIKSAKSELEKISKAKSSHLNHPVFAGGLVDNVTADSPAAKLGLARGDRFLFVNSEEIELGLELNQIFSKNPQGIFVAGVQKADKNKKNQDALELLVFRLDQREESDNMFEKSNPFVLGVQFPEVFEAGEIAQKHNSFATALSMGANKTWELCVMTVKSLWMLVTFQVPASQIGGPIAIFGVAGQAAEQGISFYLFIMCLISVNLGILNLVPIPALDGGHLLLFFIEFVQRKPLSVKTRQIATQIGIAFLLCVMALSLFNDLSKYF